MANPPRRNAHISQGFECLAAALGRLRDEQGFHFDVVVIGSGYGGAVAAAELAGSRPKRGQNALRVAVLERGREYLPGAFPTGLAELPRHIRYSNDKNEPHGERTALWDFRVGSDMAVLVGNGVGGGSLINAGVMEEPTADVLSDPMWPREVQNDPERKKWFAQASQAVGATTRKGEPNAWPDEELPKLKVFDKLAKKPAKRVALTVAIERKPSAGDVQLEACVRCGDCATGCNFGAKESLDTSLLAKAQRAGAAIYSGATVLRLAKRDGGWTIVVTHTDHKLRRRQEQPFELYARRVVLAAGTLGSTEILLRSRSDQLRFSTQLGHRFSGNGDMLAALVDLNAPANAIADERVAPNQRKVGPTITAMIDERAAKDKDARCVIQELSVPSPLRRLFEEVNAVAAAFDTLGRGDEAMHTGGDDERDPCAIDDASTEHSMTVAIIGHDAAEGVIELNGTPAEWGDVKHGDGAVHIRWPESCRDERLSKRQSRLDQLLRESGLKGRALANPMWRLLSPELEFLFDAARGPLLTVHPLGGCAMGQTAAEGVVDHIGRVYDPKQPDGVHDGLVVLDGSIVPRSLGINPALTITALSLRAMSYLIRDWELEPAPKPEEKLFERPFFRRVRADAPAIEDPVPTRVEMIERMSGRIEHPFRPIAFYAEITLQFKPCNIRELMSPTPPGRRLVVDPEHSRLRLFTEDAWREAQERPDDDVEDDQADWIAPLSGSLTIFRREPSTPAARRWRAFLPWVCNRGLRDTWQDFYDRFVEPRLIRLKLSWSQSPRLPQPETLGFFRSVVAVARELFSRVMSTVGLLSLAGEARLFEYDLSVGAAIRGQGKYRWLSQGTKLEAVKHLTYNRRGNPWNQLLEAELTRAPFRAPQGLKLDLRFLERRATPLVRLLDQQDQATALVDVVSFLLYALRVVLRVHTWSFRKPDTLPPKPIDRFPRLDGVTAEIFELDTTAPKPASDTPDEKDPAPDKPASKIRLTRFAPLKSGKGQGRPVLMIHGYSVSGTTFAHPRAPSLAKALAEAGYDAWIVDLRTSAAFETARLPWSFEEVAYADIPRAVDHIVRHTGFDKIDIVAHCMGSAMVCMALLDQERESGSLDPYRDNTPIPDPFPELRRKLKPSIHRLVLSQVAPVTLFTPANLFRAFVLRYLRHYLNLEDYAFRVEGPPSISDQLLDRFLATLPYPTIEFDRENPTPWRMFKRTPWTSTRHRMDALYGRDFSLKNVSDQTLEYIDDFFGPLNIETVSQAIHFARFRLLTDKTGYNRYVTLKKLGQQLDMPVLSLHGEENGLVDPATEGYLSDRWRGAGFGDNSEHITLRIPEHGHQDCFIGVDAKELVFDQIIRFLNGEKVQC